MARKRPHSGFAVLASRAELTQPELYTRASSQMRTRDTCECPQPLFLRICLPLDEPPLRRFSRFRTGL